MEKRLVHKVADAGGEVRSAVGGLIGKAHAIQLHPRSECGGMWHVFPMYSEGCGSGKALWQAECKAHDPTSPFIQVRLNATYFGGTAATGSYLALVVL
eukprot:4187405-Amphidinium_carterae.1